MKKQKWHQAFLVFLGMWFILLGLHWGWGWDLHYAHGRSMSPTMAEQGWVLVKHIETIRVGDIVRAVDNEDISVIKRVVALPGDRVQFRYAFLYRNDERITQRSARFAAGTSSSWALGDNEFFLAGDNGAMSYDSQDYGPVKREQVVSKVWATFSLRDGWQRWSSPWSDS